MSSASMSTVESNDLSVIPRRRTKGRIGDEGELTSSLDGTGYRFRRAVGMNRASLWLDLLPGDGHILGGSIPPKASWKNEICTLQEALRNIQTREPQGDIFAISEGPTEETRQGLSLRISARAHSTRGFKGQ